VIRLKDLTEIICAPDTPTSEILLGLNESVYLFFCVVDSDRRLLGTITDGDIRRAILEGATLNDPASRCMYQNAVSGVLGADEENELHLRSLPFLPILDTENRLLEVLVPAPVVPGLRTALVMAGGFGKRLGEKTRNTPKPLLPIGEKPILERILDDLEANGVQEIFISVHYLAEQIEEFILHRKSAAEIRILREKKMLGTAGALALLPPKPMNPVLVVNGDLITRTDFAALNDFHWRHNHDATIAVAQHEMEIPFGVVQHDGNGMFLGIEEKPLTQHFVAAGIYYLSPEFMALIPHGRRMDMPDLLNSGREIGLRIGLFPIHEYWRDIGRPGDFEAASRDYSAPKSE
jgi:dTDP-glucose pyrophosphorylase